MDKYSVQKNSDNLGRYSSLNCPHFECKLPFKEYEKGRKRVTLQWINLTKHCISKETKETGKS